MALEDKTGKTIEPLRWYQLTSRDDSAFNFRRFVCMILNENGRIAMLELWSNVNNPGPNPTLSVTSEALFRGHKLVPLEDTPDHKKAQQKIAESQDTYIKMIFEYELFLHHLRKMRS